MKKSPLKRSTKQLTRTPIPFQSAKRKAVAPERRKFVKLMLREHPVCIVSWDNCTVRTVDVHEAFRRGRGGAFVPGDVADRQKQRFYTVCRNCHNQLTNPTALERLVAVEEGWIKDQPG